MEPIEELKATCDKIGKAFEEFKAENNKLIAKGVKDALAESKLDKLSQSIDDLTGTKEGLEKRIKAEAELREELERKVNKLRLGTPAAEEVEQKALTDWNMQVKAVAADRRLATPADSTMEDFRAYKAAHTKYLRKGKDSLTAEEHKAMIVGSDVDGGFFVPSDTTGRIVQKVYELSPIRQIANVQSISSDRLEGIEDLGESSAGWVGEIGTRSDSTTPQIGKYEIVAHELYAQPKASQKLLDDASVDIEAWLQNKVANKFARFEGAAFVSGTGVTQPRGFTTYTVAATGDATRAWGTMEYVGTGANGAFNSTSPADVLFTLIQAFKPAYLANARWVTTREVISAVRKLKEATTNAYMWQPGLQQGQPSQLLGYPIVMAQDMPALSTNGLSMALGDFNAGYQIVDRLGVRVIRDNLTDKPYVKFYTLKRVGAGVVNFEAIKFIKFA